MKGVLTAGLLGCLLLVIQGQAQTSLRLRSMGKLVVAVQDSERGINPYDLAGNPAWLLRDETRDWLQIQPVFLESRGSYRRLFDPGEVTAYGAGSDGVRTLGEAGTFRGGVMYTVDHRRQVYRSLKRNPYAGEAFFLNDTTTGDVTYNGPAVAFMYAYEVVPSVILGASAAYRILDGLKYRYSNTKSLWRDMRGTIGVTVEPAAGLVVGAVYSPRSGQERLEAKSDDLLDVEVIHVRGETYAIRQRASTVNHKVKTTSQDLGAHLFWTSSAGAAIGVETRYGIGKKQILLSRESEKDVEDGFENSEEVQVTLVAQTPIFDRLVVGCFGGLDRRRDWSRHTPRDLLLWEWSARTVSAGTGLSGSVGNGLLLAAEYEYGQTVVDSSKHIDNRFRNVSPTTHTLRLGIELRPSSALALRGGWALAATDLDLLTDAGPVRKQTVTGGFLVSFSPTASLDGLVEFLHTSAGSATRSTLGVELRLTLGWQ